MRSGFPLFQLRAHLRRMGIFDLLANRKRLFSVANGPGTFTELVKYKAHIPQRRCLHCCGRPSPAKLPNAVR